MSPRMTALGLLCASSLAGCFLEANVRGGAAFTREHPVFAGGAQLAAGVAYERARAGVNVGARAAGDEGTRWLLGLSGGAIIGAMRERPGFYGLEVLGLVSTPVEQGQLLPRREFQLGARVNTQWWIWRRRSNVDRGRSLWIVNTVPVITLGLETRVNFDRPVPGGGYEVVPDVSLVVGFQYQIKSDFLTR